MNLDDNCPRSWGRRREYRAILADLDARTDAELAGLGLTRGEGALERAAFLEATRRTGRPDVAPPLKVAGRYRAANTLLEHR